MMTKKEKALVIGAIDDFLIKETRSLSHLKGEHREKMDDYLNEVIDTTSPKDIRESLSSLITKLYEGLFYDDNNEVKKNEYGVFIEYFVPHDEGGEAFIGVINKAIESFNSYPNINRVISYDDLTINISFIGVNEYGSKYTLTVKVKD